jgi:aminoglycoside N3'-acetyltransferase
MGHVSRAALSRPDLIASLHRLGVRGGDTLMVHASLRALGPVDGGAQGVVEALKGAVGPEGTLVMILGAELDWFEIDEPPDVSVQELLEIATPFDAHGTPALEEVGVLAEIFRKSDGVMVTDHPDGRFAAWGARAPELVRDTPWHHYYGPDSVLDRLCRGGGRVLRLGANWDTVTVLHLAEYLANLPRKRARTLHFLVASAQGPQLRSVTSLDNSNGIVDWRGEDYFSLIVKAYVAAGHGVRGQVGGARSELFDAAHLVDFGARWMEAHLASCSPNPPPCGTDDAGTSGTGGSNL